MRKMGLVLIVCLLGCKKQDCLDVNIKLLDKESIETIEFKVSVKNICFNTIEVKKDFLIGYEGDYGINSYFKIYNTEGELVDYEKSHYQILPMERKSQTLNYHQEYSDIVNISFYCPTIPSGSYQIEFFYKNEDATSFIKSNRMKIYLQK